MGRRLFLLAIAISGTSYAQQIPVLNAGFEALVLKCSPTTIDQGGCYNGAIPGWLPGWFNEGAGGTFLPGPNQFPGGVPGGVNCGYVGILAGQTGAIFQVLNATLQANTIYVLHMSIGHRADVPFTGYVASLLAGGIEVASDNTLNPAAGTFVEETITYQTGPTPALLGQLLGISVKSVGSGGQVDIDNISLTAASQ